jgi:ATP synthase protein I
MPEHPRGPNGEAKQLSDLQARLDRARSEHAERTGAKKGDGGVGPGLSMGIELVAAVLVGAGMGWVLDRIFHTSPWLMIVFFLFGMAAGLRNAMRKAESMSKRAREAAPAKEDAPNGSL